MTLTSGKHADEVRQMWQCRALVEADAIMQRALLAAIACEYPADVIILLKTTFGTIQPPSRFYKGYAFISPAGRVFCKMYDKSDPTMPLSGHVEVYESEAKFISEMRKLADKLKLSDADRIDMFRVLSKWVTRDERFTHNNEKMDA